RVLLLVLVLVLGLALAARVPALLLPEQLFQQRLVGGGILQRGVLRQRLVVGGDRFLQLAGAGQGVAAVVVGVGAVEPGEGLRRGAVVAGAVLGAAAP